MKPVDIALILALMIASILGSSLLDHALPGRAALIPVTTENHAAISGAAHQANILPAAQHASFASTPAAQAAVGLVCLLFGALACFPLFLGTGTDHRPDERTE